MSDCEEKTGARPRRAERTLGWASAVAVATLGLLGAMGTVPAQAQPADLITRGADEGGPYGEQRTLNLPLGQAAIIDLPRAASEIIVSDPDRVEAIIRTPRRVYVMGRQAGTVNVFFLDARDQQILTLDVRINQDTAAIADMLRRLMPTSRIDVESAGGAVVLSGTVDRLVDGERAVELATRFIRQGARGDAMQGEPIINMISVREPAQVMLKVRILEMQRTLIRQLGIDLDGVARLDESVLSFATANGLGTGGFNGDLDVTAFDDLDPLGATINAFEQNGLVKTLAEPSLVALSGETANFSAGGTLFLPVAQQFGAVGAVERDFGVELDFLPTVRSKGSIKLEIATSVSDVSAALSVGDFPGLVNREARTTIELPSGASFAIAGLLQDDIQEVVAGVPAAKDVPVLGQLFRSQRFQSDQTELVIIATPYLVEPSTLAELTDPGEGHAPAGLVQSVLLGKLESAYGVNRRGVSEARLSGPMGFILD